MPSELRQAFEECEYATGTRDALKTNGNEGAYLKIVEKDGYAHFFLCTLWDSMESMKKCEYNEPQTAVDYPKDKKYGLVSDPIVIIQEAVSDKNNINA